MYEFCDLRLREFSIARRPPRTRLDPTSMLELARIVAILGPFCPYDLQRYRITQRLLDSTIRQLYCFRNHVRLRLSELGWNPRPMSMLCYPGPGFVINETRLRSCTLPTWCPFCWSRGAVTSVFRKLDRTLQRRPRDQRRLVMREWAKLFPAAQPPEEVFKFPIPNFRKSGVQLVVVEPRPEGWLLSCRTLHLPEELKGLAGGPPAGLTETLSRVKLARLTGRFCRYPTGFLTENPVRIKRLLEQRQGRRLLTSYGVFRNDAKTRPHSVGQEIAAVTSG